ncbi:aminoglycoside phosphotransferase family protein [Virgibacillus sp. NKC19-3]|uniref:phosphotransferase family protein n=1 Tax=Virgibacillus saliphilus TaxID=2831674 RepID=UPI001C9ADF67|nr:aminoglycoside phosphotransferase family protein [Virgibacillus sp. NKC19-3]MBY7142158.1 aminoglycoside phosphotransferase family protein [Virgibacillus sp. NKC19-3]
MGVPKSLLDWVKQQVHINASVQSVEPLKGSTSSILHRITLHVDENPVEVVVRQFNDQEWLDKEPDLAMHEAASLQMASKVGFPTPEIIAYDEKGEICGIPVVVMSKLEGNVNLKPRDRDEWLAGLAEALANIHTAEASNFPWTYFPYNAISETEIPEWSSVPDVWEKAIAIAKGPRPNMKNNFIHRDFHPANVMWRDEKVSGIVDWVNACLGPAGIDVGHCRVNLAMLYDVETAAGFLEAYKQFAGKTYKHALHWDLISAMDMLSGKRPSVYLGWKDFGITGLTDHMMEERLDRYIVHLMQGR